MSGSTSRAIINGRTYPRATPTEGERALCGTKAVPASPLGPQRVLEGPNALTAWNHDAVEPRAGLAKEMAMRLYCRSSPRLANLLRLHKQPELHYTPVSPSEASRLIDRWQLRPGDFLVVGGTHADHLMMYVGRNRRGEHELIHAMPTVLWDQSLWQSGRAAFDFVLNRLRGREDPKVGVIREPVRELFGRVKVGAVIGMRDPRLTDAMRTRGLAHVATLVGSDFDYDMRLGNDAYYCTEVLAELERAAYATTNEAPPRLGTTHLKAGIEPLAMGRFLLSPDNVVASPDLEIVGANALGEKSAARTLDNVVSA